MAASAWPLPVYQPTLKTWPSDIAVDADGVTLCLGITAGSINPAKKLQWVIVPPASRGAVDAPRAQGLSVGLAPQVIKPLSQLMIVSDVSRIHVQDTPTKTLPLFADRTVMTELFPDLKRYGPELDIRTELVIADAIEAEADKETGGLVFNLSKVQLQTRIREAANSEWRPFAVFDIHIRQQVEPRLAMPTFARREFRLDWSMPAKFDVNVRFADGYAPEDKTISVDRANELVSAGWREFTAGNADGGGKPVSDVNVASGALRMSSVAWQSPFISVAFGPAGVRLTNSAAGEWCIARALRARRGARIGSWKRANSISIRWAPPSRFACDPATGNSSGPCPSAATPSSSTSGEARPVPGARSEPMRRTRNVYPTTIGTAFK